MIDFVQFRNNNTVESKAVVELPCGSTGYADRDYSQLPLGEGFHKAVLVSDPSSPVRPAFIARVFARLLDNEGNVMSPFDTAGEYPEKAGTVVFFQRYADNAKHWVMQGMGTCFAPNSDRMRKSPVEEFLEKGEAQIPFSGKYVRSGGFEDLDYVIQEYLELKLVKTHEDYLRWLSEKAKTQKVEEGDIVIEEG